uniref:Glycosyltransferase n=1 Tax=Scoparia dulcis TaxID=107240 RepID=A0A5H2Q8X7_SCODU|nr:UDP-glycosyltransferase [Scoparia dulcis]
MAFKSEHTNFVLIPFMAPGHIIPMIDMAKSLAKHGVSVKTIVTPLDAKRFGSVIERAVRSGLSIQLLQFPFPCEEAGLPPGCESGDCMPSYELLPNFARAINLSQEPVERMLKELKPRPSCIICDRHLAWTADTCNKLDVPRIVFDGMNCLAQLVMHNLYKSNICESIFPMEPFIVPGLPDALEFTKLQLPDSLNPGPIDYGDFHEQVRKTESIGYGVVINTFEELEQRYVDEFRKVKGGKVWCIGPLFLCSDDKLDKTERGNQASMDSDRCLKWLDGMKPDSVVYACLGSLSRMSLGQFIELALGLEASGHPFILVVKTGENSSEIENWILEDGFEERMKGRGLLLRGWAPQVLILSHPSVGGFLTHCGWNSTLEGISAGVPMITFPMFGEQFFNEKLVVQVLGIGMGVGARIVTHMGEEEKPEARVTRDGIMTAVERVMDTGRGGNERRKRAKELGEMAKSSVRVGGSSYINTAMFIQEIAELSQSKQ